MGTEETAAVDDIVAESALQLWSAAQTDFDPFEVPTPEWPSGAVMVRDADIAVDTHLDIDVVQASLDRLDGLRVVLGREGGRRNVLRIVPTGAAP